MNPSPIDLVAPGPRPGVGPVGGSPPAPPARREEAARQLESLFLSVLVKEMRQTLPGDGLFGSGPGAAIFEGFFDNLFSESMAAGPGSGLRQAILDSLPPDVPAAVPGSPAGTAAAPHTAPDPAADAAGPVMEIGQ